MPLPSVEAFLELTRKSQVVDHGRLSACLDRLRAAGEYKNDPAALAALLVRDAILTDFQASLLLDGKWRGFQVGKYKILERLGQGGMGTVYLAEHKFMKRRVAIKVLPKSKAKDSSSLERFYREAKAIAALDHPNIVRAYDIDHDPDQSVHFLVMEYVDGASFQEIIKAHGAIAIEQATNYVAQSALAMQHAHEIGIVHRDIKPGNILVDRYGIVKVLDMGLARFFHDEEDMLTRKYDENVLGTADYLAPEQALDSHTVDIRADIYSLGCTFYFILTGKSPFGDGTVAQKLIWHQTRKAKPMHEWRAGLPDDLVAIVEKMMAKPVDERYQLPAEVAEALAPWNQQPLGPPPIEWMPVLSPAAGGPAPESFNSAGSLLSSAPTTLRKPASSVGSATTPGSAVRAGGSALTARPSVPGAAAQTGMAASNGAGSGSLHASEGGGGSSRQGKAGEPRPATVHHNPVRPMPGGRPGIADAPGAPGDEASAWQAFTDTASQSAQAQDTLRGGKRGRRSDHISAGSRWEDPVFRRNALIVGIVGGVLVVAGLAVGVYLLLFNDSSPPLPKAGGPGEKPAIRANVLYVSKSKVDATDFETLAAAIRRAGPGDRILVRDQEVYEERLDDSLLHGKRNLIIEAERDASGRTATIRAPDNLPAGEPLVSIEKVDGLRLKGFNLDGARRCDEMIKITGMASNTVLEELRIKGFSRAGIHFASAQGVRGRELILRDIWLEPDRDKNLPAVAALYFSLPPRLASGATSNVLIQNCRFLGPYAQAVLINTPLVQVAFERCVFHGGGKQCFAYPSTAPGDLTLDFRLVGNTISGFESGLDLQQQPNFISSNLLVRENLFYHISLGAVQIRADLVDKLPEVFKGEANFHDTASKPGNANPAVLPGFQLAALDFQLSVKSPAAADFLRFPSKSRLATAGKDKSHVGALEPLP